MIHIGDKVRFLNSVGGGIVKKIQSKDIILVEEDGFEIPILAKECVVVEQAKATETISSTTTSTSNTLSVETPNNKYKTEAYKYNPKETKKGEKITVAIAFLLQKEQEIQTTKYNTYLINESNYFLHYTISSKKIVQQQLIAEGTIEPNTQYLFYELKKEELNNWEHLSVQMIAFKKDSFNYKPVIQNELHLAPIKFHKRHCFTKNDYFEQDAMLYYIIKEDTTEEPIFIKPKEIKEALFNTKEKKNNEPREKREKIKNGVLEIDLHINELIDNTSGMNSKDILHYQLNVFEDTLQTYENKKGQKIVFIHGKGDGVLRTEIQKLLKIKYKKYYVQDASFREYGFGATMVTIH